MLIMRSFASSNAWSFYSIAYTTHILRYLFPKPFYPYPTRVKFVYNDWRCNLTAPLYVCTTVWDNLFIINVLGHSYAERADR